MSKIAYVTHPVLPSVKAALRASKMQIEDARFAPEGAEIIDGQEEVEAALPDAPALTANAVNAMRKPDLIAALTEQGIQPETLAGQTAAELKFALIAAADLA